MASEWLRTGACQKLRNPRQVCRLGHEDAINDLGLNPTPFANGDITVPVTQRIIMNHITAKRMLGLLSQTLQRHEQAFGVVETDVNRRLRPQG